MKKHKQQFQIQARISKKGGRYETRIKSAAEGKHRQQATLLGLKNKLDSN
jgi:hypothetical protein